MQSCTLMCHGAHSRNVGPTLALRCAGKEQERMALEAGFKEAKHYDISFGLMGILVATKA